MRAPGSGCTGGGIVGALRSGGGSRHGAGDLGAGDATAGKSVASSDAAVSAITIMLQAKIEGLALCNSLQANRPPGGAGHCGQARAALAAGPRAEGSLSCIGNPPCLERFMPRV